MDLPAVSLRLTGGAAPQDILIPAGTQTNIPVEWTGLLRYGTDAAPIRYSVAETAVPNGNTDAVTGDQAAGFTITNT